MIEKIFAGAQYMSDAIINFFQNIFGNATYLIGFIVSMIPLVELKGGILFMIFAPNGGNIWLSFLIGVLGSSVIAPILLLVFMPLINWMKKTKLFKGIATWLEKHFTKKSDDLERKAKQKSQTAASEEEQKKKAERAKYIGLFIFTAIPLPLTGCWTASVVASILHLDYKKSLLFIILGNIVAGAAITLLGGILQIPFFSK
jgi:uncharacterized membrane protein